MIAKRFIRQAFSAFLVFFAYLSVASADVKPSFVDAQIFTSALEQALVQGVQSTSQVLNRLGPDVQQALRDAQEKTDFRYYNFSARSQIEMLYQRAEAGGAGQGELFLARLKDNLALNSAALAEDPRLKFLDAVPRRSGPIVFAEIATLTGDAVAKELSPAIEEALTVLSEHTSARGLGHVRGVLLRNLNLDNRGGKDSIRKFDDLVRQSASRRGVIAAAFIAHTPPPKLQIAVQRVIEDFARSSGAFAVDPAVAKVMAGLSNELTASEQRLVQTDGAFLEAHDAKQSIRPSVDGASDAKAALALSKAIESPPGASSGGGGGLPFPQPSPRGGSELAQKHQRYVEQSFERRSSVGNAPPLPGWVQGSRPPPVPRAYRVAIMSPRAARGIAVGAEMRSEVFRRPLKAYWISDKTNQRFGRLVISFAPCKDNWVKFFWEMLNRCNGDPIVATSKRLHADSFMAANQLLWGSFGTEAQFVEGDITVLMSMNPWVLPEGLEALVNQEQNSIRKYERLVASYNATVTSAKNSLSHKSIQGTQFDSLNSAEFKKLEAKLNGLRKEIDIAKSAVETAQEAEKQYAATHGEIPRSIVFHPAIHGRELAWSAARIDFWFNDTKRLFEEAESIALDKDVTTKMRSALDTAKEGAGTWQFFEQDGVIELEQKGLAQTLIVHTSSTRASNEDGRFAVSLFRVDETAGASEDQAEHLLRGEKEIRIPLAWLQRTHPDFWRLSDFSTSLMFLRYLKSEQIQLLSFSPDDFDPQRPTPEWIYGNKVEPVVKP
ncbi:hypothetical protein HZZ13_33965 [Bradyrhizobium sp. CNPSo 4010]|uniref:Uncharacterized protein n=1 Tax=Bradyrhizobium agreste TaxID=2751811 RepID=A0ABS0Q013_9BRAD|nr:hypothetical protein [Bradyrhizobium agreste]MBH5402766.1 hypothetical protein [Bradyrhizobium agreste]